MRAVVIRSYGDPSVLQVEDVAQPAPGAGEVLIKIEAVSVNFADIRRRRNDPYPVPTPLPAVLGGEVAGVVAALGSGVTSLAIGDPVFALLGDGGYAEYAVARAERVIPLPADFDLDVACTLVVAGVTAYQLLTEAGRLERGESVFIPGALGGVGSYALQIARHMGAGTIIVGASTAERRSELLTRGADHAVDYTDEGWPDQVKAITGGLGADVVLDMVGGKLFHQSLAALASFGRLVVYGTAGLEPTTVAPPVLLGRNQSVVGYYVAEWFARRPAQSKKAFDTLVDLISNGTIDVTVADRLPLEGAGEAHLTMQERRATGKFVLKPWLRA